MSDRYWLKWSNDKIWIDLSTCMMFKMLFIEIWDEFVVELTEITKAPSCAWGISLQILKKEIGECVSVQWTYSTEFYLHLGNHFFTLKI